MKKFAQYLLGFWCHRKINSSHTFLHAVTPGLNGRGPYTWYSSPTPATLAISFFSFQLRQKCVASDRFLLLLDQICPGVKVLLSWINSNDSCRSVIVIDCIDGSKPLAGTAGVCWHQHWQVSPCTKYHQRVETFGEFISWFHKSFPCVQFSIHH